MTRSQWVLGACSDLGTVRELNEDCSAAVEFRGGVRDGSPVYVIAVADGVGGGPDGEVASRTAVDTFLRIATSGLVCAPTSLGDLLDDGFAQSVRAVYEAGLAGQDESGMATTFTAAIIHDGGIQIGHIGDSRAYLIRGGTARQLTRDHSVVQDKVAAGLITQEEAARSSERNLLSRCLGRNPEALCDIVYEDLFPGDAVLLCTDGLHGALSAAEIAQSISANPRNPQQACEDLVAAAVERDGSDNTTAACAVLPEDLPAKRSSRGGPRRIVLAILLAAVLVGGALVVSAILRQNQSAEPLPGARSSAVSTSQSVKLPATLRMPPTQCRPLSLR